MSVPQCLSPCNADTVPVHRVAGGIEWVNICKGLRVGPSTKQIHYRWKLSSQSRDQLARLTLLHSTVYSRPSRWVTEGLHRIQSQGGSVTTYVEISHPVLLVVGTLGISPLPCVRRGQIKGSQYCFLFIEPCGPVGRRVLGEEHGPLRQSMGFFFF